MLQHSPELTNILFCTYKVMVIYPKKQQINLSKGKLYSLLFVLFNKSSRRLATQFSFFFRQLLFFRTSCVFLITTSSAMNSGSLSNQQPLLNCCSVPSCLILALFGCGLGSKNSKLSRIKISFSGSFLTTCHLTTFGNISRLTCVIFFDDSDFLHLFFSLPSSLATSLFGIKSSFPFFSARNLSYDRTPLLILPSSF